MGRRQDGVSVIKATTIRKLGARSMSEVSHMTKGNKSTTRTETLTLEQLCADHRGKAFDKWSSYISVYERIFAQYRNKPIRLLEIGVQNGGSLEIWAKYLPNAQKVVGCDINPACAQLSYDDPRIAVVIGDANSDETQTAILDHAPTIDIVIDDGSHHSSDVLKSFPRYFPYLANGGVFIVEDMHCSYWRKYEGGLYDPFSSISFFKCLADIINHEHWGVEKPRTDLLRGFLSKYGLQISEETLQTVHSIEFLNSLCIVRKETPANNALNTRVIGGSTAIIHPPILGLHSTPALRSDETKNEWTARSMPLSEELALRRKELAEQGARIASLKQSVTEHEEHIVKLHRTIAERDDSLTKRDGRISVLEQAVAERDAEAKDLAVKLNAQETRVARLADELRARDAELGTSKAHVKDLEGKVAAGGTELGARTKELRKREGEVKALRQHIANLEARVSEIYGSRSWRITRPLRASSRGMKWFYRNNRRAAKLAWWLGTGQFRRAVIAAVPYYQRLLPLSLKRIIPSKLRQGAKRYIAPQADMLRSGVRTPPLDKAVAEAETAFRAENWRQAITAWQAVLNTYGNNDAIACRAKLAISVARRLSTIAEYKRQIVEYASARATIDRAAKGAPKIAVYAAISGNYDSIKLPERLESRFDYVLFTDSPMPDTGIWQIRPVTYFHTDKTRTARFVKTHPHMLLQGYDIAVWIDANIMILGEIYPLVEEFLASGRAVAAVPHPFRKSIYQELDACIQLKTDEPETMQEQIAHYRKLGFDCQDLIESNFMMFNLRDSRVRPFLDCWWKEIDRFSKRDQLSLNYALNEHGLAWHSITDKSISIRNHPKFARVLHDGTSGPAQKLITGIQAAVIDPYEGSSYAGIREHRIAAQRHRKIDIVVCVHNALADVKLCLESIRRARNNEQHALIIVDDGSDQPTAQYLEKFAHSAPWIKLHRNPKPLGYTKAANQGLRASTGELVILLNSDTIVTDGWAEKLADAVFATPGAGIVGPMSNAASHQSIPEHRGTKDQTAINDLPPGLTAEDMNRYCEQWTTADVLPRVPLVHGFCFGVTREVIDKVGLFDEENFPRGYGEENEYCFRAVDAGFSLVIATHTYIFHAKSKSYAGPERVALMQAGADALKRLHGRPRVERAVKSMQQNPILEKFRERARNLIASLSSGLDRQIKNTEKSAPRSSSGPAKPQEGPRIQTTHYATYDVSSDILKANWDLIDRFRANPHLTLDRALWVVPSFDHIYRGGIYTIFRVADGFSRRFGTMNTIVLHGGKKIPLAEVETMIGAAFPALKFRLISVASWDEVDALPPSDAAFCTLWTSAYLLVRYNKCKAKFYLIQDFEPAFYAAGSRYGVIEQTYRFGFNGIANTPGVGEMYRQYNPWVQYFVPGVDKSIFRPKMERSPNPGVQRVVFYGRPQNERNAFDLGVSALSLVKRALGDSVEIISVGADFSESDLGLKGILSNWGVLRSIEEVAELYRSSDAGLVLMYTAHPSYQPFEFMASGCATVSNFNRYTQWFLRDGDNAALAHSTVTGIAERILDILRDRQFRDRIVAGGFKTVEGLEWETALDRICDFVRHPVPSRQPFISSASPNGAIDHDSVADGGGAAISVPNFQQHDSECSAKGHASVSFDSYDFADFGCSEGGSFRKATEWFGGGRGIGLDIDPKKVERARKEGFDAAVCDITQLTAQESAVRFVIASHFLEHLPSRQEVVRCLRSACRLASDFVYIECPYFDADGFLFQHGLKMYWSHWRGHTCHLTTLEMFNVLRELKEDGLLHRFAVYANGPILSSDDSCIHALESDIDQHQWDAGKHPPKPLVKFDRPVFKETKALIGLSNNDVFEATERRFRWSAKLYDSGRS